MKQSILICLGGLLAFVITLCLLPLCIYLAKHWQIIDQPDGQLKKHAQPTPYLGGLAVYGGLWGAVALCYRWFKLDFNLGPLFISTTALLLLGIWDDQRVLTPGVKLTGQLLITLLFLGANWYLMPESALGTSYSYLLLTGYFLAVINAVNLIDIMDGLAGTATSGALLIFLLWALWGSANTVALLCLVGLGATLAFLVYNLPPAFIYLGDGGALLLGGYLAYLPYYLPVLRSHTGGWLLPLVALAVPLLELASLIVIRSCKQQPIYLGSPDHFALYLQAKGWSKRQILGWVLAGNLLLLLVSSLFYYELISWPVLLLSAIGFLWGWWRLVF